MKTRDLRLLVMHVSTRCDQTCAHCSIWKGRGQGSGELGVEQRLEIVREARALGARSILFTGGEPLLCAHLETLAREARGLGLLVQIATNGLGLSRSAPWICEVVEEVYISLEGPQSVHDGIRGPGMFARLKDSLDRVRARPLKPRLIGRSVVSSRNAAALEATVEAARSLGLDALSFLPIDSTSDAFGGDPKARGSLRPGVAEVADMRRAIGELSAAGDLGTFVLENERKLRAMADGFGGEASSAEAPLCNAPEWSSVVEADGAIRPCFFQPPVSPAGPASLAAVRRSNDYATTLGSLGRGHPICAACVCPKYSPRGIASIRDRVRERLVHAIPGLRPRVGSAA